jgi:hypothetical protein
MVFVPSKSSRSHAMMELCHVRLPLFSLAVPPRLAWPRRRTCTVVLLYHPNPLTPSLSPAHPRPRRPIAASYQRDLSLSHMFPTWHRAATIAIESLEASGLASP